MKKINIILFLVYFTLGLSQEANLKDLYSKKEYDNAIKLAQKILISSPEDFNTQLMLLKIYNSKCDYPEASTLLAKMSSSDEKFLIESLKTNYGLGNTKEAKRIYDQLIKDSKNEVLKNELLKFGLVTGLDQIYDDWKIKETQNIIFHFQQSVSAEKMQNIIVSRQKAFEKINNFFNSVLPKKIDFFVWDTEESYNSYLKTNLGFTFAQFCISHNRLNQSPGHEIAHNISFWKNPEQKKVIFINEGIGVYFDQQGNNRLEAAKEAYRKDPANIKEIWQNNRRAEESIMYPIAGAFIEYLIQYDKEKLLQLTEDQTYENAVKVYDKKIYRLIEDFIKTLESD
ncbi:tetratricopeptide repeat protein [Chryseobacterium lathyri]|uniref:Uncharacterized protein n=1 Tax=Chryseobacterium lathyri TaxID=395933 RepID=A0A511YFE4_9FLAO|nr:hypothetical protein [Chryseobacterium lathyri]GEN73925.1 hypothetical protein CLA01_39970 [Chryseobacterium lathyri]